MKKPVVAIYSGDIPSTTFIENLVHAVAGRGCQVYLFGNRKKPVRYAEKNIHVFAAPRNRFLYGLWLGWNSLKLAITQPEKHRKLNALVQSMADKGRNLALIRGKYLPVFLHTPDIIHVQWAKSAPDWTPLKEMLGVRLVLSFRGAHINYSPLADPTLAAAYRDAFPRYDAFHAVSAAIATEGRKYGTGNGIIRVIHTGIDTTSIGKFNKRRNDDPGRQPLRIISVGRFHWKKGYHIAFEAIRKLKEAGIGIRYTIVAGGRNDEEAVYLIHDMGLQDQVVFHRDIPQEQVFALMAESDLLLLPSVEEGIANVVLEAMAIGLPVLSSDCGGMPEAIEEGGTGLLFRNRDANHLAEQMIRFMKMSPEEKQTMTTSAQKNVQEKFGLDRLGSEMISLYGEVIANRHAS